jgi:tetratricopeptide (TPR) repeat protein
MKKIIIFLLLTLFLTKTEAQSGLSTDTLASLIDLNKTDTSQLNYLNDLGWQTIYSDPDSAIRVLNISVEKAIVMLKTVTTNDSLLRRKLLFSIGTSYTNLGVANEFKGNFDQALWYHNRALKIGVINSDKKTEAVCYNNIGIVYDSKGDYNNALTNYLIASRKFAEEQLTWYMAGAYNNIGIVYQRLNDDRNALIYFSKAEKMFIYLHQNGALATVCTNLGISYKNIHKPDSALYYLYKGLELEKENQNTYNIAILNHNLGIQMYQGGDYQKAIRYQNVALDLYSQMGIQYGVCSSLMALGAVDHAMKNYPAAKKNYDGAMSIAKQIGATDLEKDSYEGLSKVYASTGEFAKAYDYQVKFKLLFDSLFNDQKLREFGGLETKYKMESEERERIQKEQNEKLQQLLHRRRRNTVQYSGIMLILIIVSLVVTLLGFIKVKPSVASGISFFAFLLLFEFLMVIFDPTIDRWSNGEPAYKLLFNAIIAVTIFPVHAFFERKLKGRLVRKDI